MTTITDLTPVPEAERRDWARWLSAWQRSADAGAGLRDRAAPVFAALDRLRAGQRLSTALAVAALGALGDSRVRNLMLSLREPAAGQLWSYLLRHAPEAWVVDVAVLLATWAHLHGDEALAAAAVRRALAVSPPMLLTALVERSVTPRPSHLQALLADLATEPSVPEPVAA